MAAEGLRTVFLGTADFAVPTLRALARGPDEIAAVITRPDRPAGRGRKLRSSPVAVAARELGLPLHQPERASSPEGIELLPSLQPDLLLVAAFGEILSPAVLAIARIGAVNLHASLLPRYRGAAPIQRAILGGETRTGVTVQWMAEELDAGDVILQAPTSIGEEEDFGSLHDRLAEIGARAAVEAMGLLRGGDAPRTPQDHAKATYAPSVRREELEIDWRRPAGELALMVRAFSPRPGARTTRRGQLVKLLSARAMDESGSVGGIPGEVTEVTGEGFQVEAGERRLLVLKVQPAGGRPMAAADYARGRRLDRGERLGR